jgi:Na+/pantothenate symporter
VVLCWWRLTSLAQMIAFTGAVVGSAIWPIVAGLYWERASRVGAPLAMLLGSALGLWAYFAIGFYTAALVGAAVSMVVMLLATWLAPSSFDWALLRRLERVSE